MAQDAQLVTTQQQVMSLDELEQVSKKIAASGLFGFRKAEEAYVLMLICRSEGIDPILALRRYHIIEGKPSMRADAMQGEFEEKGCAIIWHVRTDSEVACTFFRDAKTAHSEEAIKRAAHRYSLLLQLAIDDGTKEHALKTELAKISRPGEETIIRTIKDAEEKGLTQARDGYKKNWRQSPRQMLTARCVSEGVRVIRPGLIAGIYTEDEASDIAHSERAELADTKGVPVTLIEAQAKVTELKEAAATATTKAEQRALIAKATEIQEKILDAEDTVVVPVTNSETGEQVGFTANDSGETVITAGSKTPSKIEQQEDEEANFGEVRCHIGKASGPLLGKKLSELFGPEVKLGRAKKFLEFFKDFENKTHATVIAAGESGVLPADLKLCDAVNYFRSEIAKRELAEHAEKATKKQEKQEPEPETESKQETPNTEQAPATPAHHFTPRASSSTADDMAQVMGKDEPMPETKPAEPAKQSAAFDWRSAKVEYTKCTVHGEELGGMTVPYLRSLKEQILPKIDWKVATKEQKQFRAALAVAVGELGIEEEKPALLIRLREKIAALGSAEPDFLTTLIGWGVIPTKAKPGSPNHLANYEEDEMREMLRTWPEIESSVKAEMSK